MRSLKDLLLSAPMGAKSARVAHDAAQTDHAGTGDELAPSHASDAPSDADHAETRELAPTSAIARAADGKFAPGKSANPLGRPKGLSHAEFKTAMRDRTGAAMERLDRILAYGSDKDATKVLELLLAYAYGRPAQAIEMSGPDGGPMQSEVKAAVLPVKPLGAKYLAEVAEIYMKSLGRVPPPMPSANPPILPESTHVTGSQSQIATEGREPEKAERFPNFSPGSEDTPGA